MAVNESSIKNSIIRLNFLQVNLNQKDYIILGFERVSQLGQTIETGFYSIFSVVLNVMHRLLMSMQSNWSSIPRTKQNDRMTHKKEKFGDWHHTCFSYILIIETKYVRKD